MCSLLLRFLEPITRLSTLMSTDIGEVLPMFWIGMWAIRKQWDSQPYDDDRAKGFEGVSHRFALRANKILYDKWEKHEHSLDAAAALLHPYNHVKLSELDPIYGHLKVGDVPSEEVLDSLKAARRRLLDDDEDDAIFEAEMTTGTCD